LQQYENQQAIRRMNVGGHAALLQSKISGNQLNLLNQRFRQLEKTFIFRNNLAQRLVTATEKDVKKT
jgi:hypothetical protein